MPVGYRPRLFSDNGPAYVLLATASAPEAAHDDEGREGTQLE